MDKKPVGMNRFEWWLQRHSIAVSVIAVLSSMVIAVDKLYQWLGQPATVGMFLAAGAVGGFAATLFWFLVFWLETNRFRSDVKSGGKPKVRLPMSSQTISAEDLRRMPSGDRVH